MSSAVQSILEMIQRLSKDDRVDLAAEVDKLTRNGHPATSLRDIEPASVGRILRQHFPVDDLFE